MKDKALKAHENGKIAITSLVPLQNAEDLALAYTPGVAHACLAIKENPEDVYRYTSKAHMVAIISDGTAVLGLGDIGPQASMPVMEGKALLLKKFADVDGFPIVINSKDPDEIIKTIKLISPSFGGIILEDISSPRCVYIEEELKKELNIPLLHDDQHGTAIVVGAALINASRLVKKELKDMKAVIVGTGAAGSQVARLIYKLGLTNIFAFNSKGVVDIKKKDRYDFVVNALLEDKIVSTPDNHDNTLASILVGADVVIGLSVANIIKPEMIALMAKDAICFAMSNPIPEIMPDVARAAGARVVGTGRSDFPNQINNVLAFPGIFKGTLQARATKITDEMKIAAAKAIASIVSDAELNEDYIMPSVFDKRVVQAVSEAVINEVKKTRI